VLCPVPDVPALWDVVGLDNPFCCAYPVLSTIPEEITVSQLVLAALITVNSGKFAVITLITFITLINHEEITVNIGWRHGFDFWAGEKKMGICRQGTQGCPSIK